MSVLTTFTFRYKAVSEVFTAIKDLVNDVLERHKSNIDPSNPQDFMDIYINEINKTKDTSSSFYGKRGEESLIASMLDLFLAGMEISVTNSTTFFTKCLYQERKPPHRLCYGQFCFSYIIQKPKGKSNLK